MRLIDAMRYYFEYDCRKHDLAPDPTEFANEKLNNMTNVELLEALSNTLELFKINIDFKN